MRIALQFYYISLSTGHVDNGVRNAGTACGQAGYNRGLPVHNHAGRASDLRKPDMH